MPLPYEDLLVEINQTPKDQGLYSEMTARFKTWINNQTRLNATNMNELVSFIRSYSEEVGSKIELSLSTILNNFVELNAGWKVTPDELSFDAAGNVNGRTVKNGELFNDYQNNKAEGLYSHAEGTKTSASGVASHAQGTSTQANGDNSFAGGLNTKAEGDNSTALGTGSTVTAEGTNGTAIGTNTVVEGVNGFAGGEGSQANGNSSFSFGHGNVVDSENGVSFGNGNTVTGENGFAIGNGNTCSGIDSFSSGNNNKAQGNNTAVFGDNSTVSGQGSVSFGTENTVSGDYSLASGTNVAITENNSIGVGTEVQVAGASSVAVGSNVQLSGNYSSAIGQNLVAEYSNQHVFGKYNQNKETNVLEVGYGISASATKNIFEVRNDGYIFAGVDNIADTSADNTLAPKGYVDQEIERLDKNVWLGYIDVTTEEYHNEEEFVNILNNAVKQFTQDTNPETGGRDPKNGDQITVKITNPTEEDPEYPEIWMFRDPDPKSPEEDPSSDGKWLFFSSLQQLVDASKTTKGLVKIGDNIDVSDGLISVPVGTTSVLGVLKTGTNITNVDGLIDVPVATTNLLGVVVTGDNIQNDDGRISVPIASSTVPGVIKLGENIVVDPTGTISVPVATTDKFGLVKLSDSIVLDENNQLAMVWGTW